MDLVNQRAGQRRSHTRAERMAGREVLKACNSRSDLRLRVAHQPAVSVHALHAELRLAHGNGDALVSASYDQDIAELTGPCEQLTVLIERKNNGVGVRSPRFMPREQESDQSFDIDGRDGTRATHRESGREAGGSRDESARAPPRHILPEQSQQRCVEPPEVAVGGISV
jgi:hypothetical protein